MPKAKNEAEYHFQSCSHPNIVKIYDVYENCYNGVKCLLLVMERMDGGELFTRILVFYKIILQIGGRGFEYFCTWHVYFMYIRVI